MGEVPLSDIAVPNGLISGPFGSNLVASDYASAGVPVIRGSNMAGPYIGGEFAFVTREKFSRDLARSNVMAGDLVFTQRGTLGQVAMVPIARHAEYVVSQSQMGLRVDESVAHPKFVYYACREARFLKQVSDNAISTGVPHINLGILARLTIPYRLPAEQRAIAEVLGALDDKIAANERVVRDAEVLMLATIESVTTFVPVSNLVSQSTASRKPEEFANYVAHFSLPAFDAGAEPEIVSGRTIKSNKFALSEPCVLFSKLNPRISRIWDVCALPPEMSLASTEFVVLTPIGVDTSVLWAALCQPGISEELRQMVAGTSGSHQRIRPNDLLGVRVRDVRKLEDDLAKLVVDLGQVCYVHRKESRLLARTRDELLPLLMSGKVRVKDAETAVSEVL